MNSPCENCLVLPICISTYLSLRNVAHEVWFIKTNAYDDKQVLVPDVIVRKCSKIYEYISNLTIDSKKLDFYFMILCLYSKEMYLIKVAMLHL